MAIDAHGEVGREGAPQVPPQDIKNNLVIKIQ